MDAPERMQEAWSFSEAVDHLKGALKFGIEPSLEGIRLLAAALGDPQARFASIQVTGTNGKTSTSRMIAAILVAHGFRVGLYTSPELSTYNERVEVDGEPVSFERFAASVRTVAGVAGSIDRDLTEFELLTATALHIFGEEGVDLAVLEVGMGGVWDSTSVVDPAVSVVTGVALDHQAVLGETLPEIAVQKAGIIKPASAPILGGGISDDLLPIFLERSDACGTHARVVRYADDPTPVPEDLTIRYESVDGGVHPWTIAVRGAHGSYPGISMNAPWVFAGNAALAIASAEAALGRGLDPDATGEAFDTLTLPGRFERLGDDPVIIVDGSHNPEAAGHLATAIGGWRPTIALGVLADKDAAGIVRALAPVAADFVVVRPDSPRALGVDELATIVFDVTGHRPHIVDSLDVLVAAVREGAYGDIVITGSLTTAGQARDLLIAWRTVTKQD